MAIDVKNSTRQHVLKQYFAHGIESVIPCALSTIHEIENSKVDWRIRAEMKGELAEVTIECYLREMQKTVITVPSAVVKGLCVKGKRTGTTTEMDVTFFTPCRIYMFECKSYVGQKTITDRCTLTSGNVTTDVHRQSVQHMSFLNDHLDCCRVNRALKGDSPYKLILFELSSTSSVDMRTERDKATIPRITLEELPAWFNTEFNRTMKTNWDMLRVLPILKRLDSLSEQNFKEHLARLGGK